MRFGEDDADIELLTWGEIGKPGLIFVHGNSAHSDWWSFIAPFLADEFVRRGAARNGATWHFCRPPVIDLEFEVDCRGVDTERVLGR